MNRTIWISSTLPDACDIFSRNLRYLLHHVNFEHRPLAFACIGSANVCGDNLGPLIGTILTRHSLPNVYGTMKDPLNALTLPYYMPLLKYMEETCCLIAIDAAIGNKAQCGYLTLAKGTLFPGSALHRELPPIGHLHITGVFERLGNSDSRELLPVLCSQITTALLSNSFLHPPYSF